MRKILAEAGLLKVRAIVVRGVVQGVAWAVAAVGLGDIGKVVWIV